MRAPILVIAVLLVLAVPDTASAQYCNPNESCTPTYIRPDGIQEQTCRRRIYTKGDCSCWTISCQTTHTYPNGQKFYYDCGTGEEFCNPPMPEGDECRWNTIKSYEDTSFQTNCNSTPILVDVAGDGFALTSFAGGVAFDLNADGAPERLSWTSAGSDDAFLVLDRDGDGLAGNGEELFGNYTPQPGTSGRNGFAALAVFDANADATVDDRDPVFADLRLWTDRNHDGVSQPDELQALTSAGIAALHLDYKTSKRTDDYGNHFALRAKVDLLKGADASRWAWDVVFTTKP